MTPDNIGTGDGMTKDQWETEMCKFFHELLRGSPLGKNFDPKSVGIIVNYGRVPHEKARWETDVIHKEYDKTGDKFVKPNFLKDPKKLEKHVGKCPNEECDGTAMIIIDSAEKRKEIIGPLAAKSDYEVCPKCGSKIMHNEMELEKVHDTEIIFKADILSSPMQIKDKNGRMQTFTLRYNGLYVCNVNGKHTEWEQHEVRKMMMIMFYSEILETWKDESAVAFEAKLLDMKNG